MKKVSLITPNIPEAEILTGVQIKTKEDMIFAANKLIKLGAKNILVTFHPVTLEENTSSIQFENLLAAISKFDDTKIIFTLPNSDTNGRVIIKMIDDFIRCSVKIIFCPVDHTIYWLSTDLTIHFDS